MGCAQARVAHLPPTVEVGAVQEGWPHRVPPARGLPTVCGDAHLHLELISARPHCINLFMTQAQGEGIVAATVKDGHSFLIPRP